MTSEATAITLGSGSLVASSAGEEPTTTSEASEMIDEEDEFPESDAAKVEKASHAVAQERYFYAAKLLKGVKDESLLTDEHRRVIAMAESGHAAQKNLLSEQSPKADGWKRQSETHGHRDTVIYYKVHDDSSMTSRIETPIEESLLLPVIAVFNETELFSTWMPRYTIPIKLGMSESVKYLESGRGNQVIGVKIDMPFPLSNRECIQHAYAMDCILEDQSIVIKAVSLEPGEHHGGLVVPEPARGFRRVDLDCSILIRVCPPDHPLISGSKCRAQYPTGERILLLSVSQNVDAHVAGVPRSWVNFFNRTVLGRMWGSLLSVAEGVRDGKRPAHQEAINEKQELYGWIADRLKVMYELHDQKFPNGKEANKEDAPVTEDATAAVVAAT